MKRKSPIAKTLVKNSIAAILAAIEIHNKPLIPFRYENTSILIINAWELLLKAYIYKFQNRNTIFRTDGSTIEFDKCLNYLENEIGKPFLPIKNNLKMIYEYRCKFIHFYNEELDMIIFSLLNKSIEFYSKFIKDKFAIDMSRFDNLYLLPIGFKNPIDPINFLSAQNDSTIKSSIASDFIKDIKNISNELNSNGISEPILISWDVYFQNINSKSNADIVMSLDNQNNNTAAAIIKKQKLTDIYPFSYNELVSEIRNVNQSYSKTDISNVIKNEKIKFNSKYSAFNHRTKTDENLYKQTGEAKQGTASIYNREAVKYILGVLDELAISPSITPEMNIEEEIKIVEGK